MYGLPVRLASALLLGGWLCLSCPPCLHAQSAPPLFDLKTLDGYFTSSPSLTADGKTLVYTRYLEWGKKIPYIAHRRNGKWCSERLTFTDTLYNLAISPDGARIVFKSYDNNDVYSTSRVFITDHGIDGWSEPTEVTSLYNRDAGYFEVASDGGLSFFARRPRSGIYRSRAYVDSIYGSPEWFDDIISPDSTTTFDVTFHPNGDRLIVTQSYPEEMSGRLGPRGLFYYELIDGKWAGRRRLPLEYVWGATVTPDGNFLYSDPDQIRIIPLDSLGIDWPATD